MIDFHAHILPMVDDGSSSIDESVEMLSLMKENSVHSVVATPHFYANDEDIDSFLERRNSSFNLLKDKMNDSPRIYLGAEVKFYNGISRLKDLKKLRIESCNLLLLEMPFNRWTEYDVKEVIDIAGLGNINVVLAHIERYLSMQKQSVIQRMLDNGILFQSNASFFKNFSTKHKSIKMLKNNQIHFLGSDCHNMNERPPNIWEAVSVINNKLGFEFAQQFINYGNEMFLHNKI